MDGTGDKSDDMSAVQPTASSATSPGDGSSSQLEAVATVVASHKTNARVKFDPILELELTIVAPGRPSYPVTIRQSVPQLHMAKVQPGSRLTALVDPTDPTSVWLDLVSS